MGGKLRHFLGRDSYRLTVDVRAPVPSRQESLVPTRGTFSVARVVSVLRGCSFDGRQHLSFRCVMFGKIGSSLVCTGRVIGLLHNVRYHIGLVQFRTVPGINLRKMSVRAVITFHSCLARRNMFTAVHTSEKRSVFTTYKVLSATGRRGRGNIALRWVAAVVPCGCRAGDVLFGFNTNNSNANFLWRKAGRLICPRIRQ